MQKIIFSLGDLGGCGPEIFLKSIYYTKKKFIPITVSSIDYLKKYIKNLNLNLNVVEYKDNLTFSKNTIFVINYELKESVIIGKENINIGEYTFKCLVKSTELCENKKGDALVTLPINKYIINKSGIPF